MSPMGTALFPLMFGGFGSSASLDSPAWQGAGDACEAGQGCHNFTVEQTHFRTLFRNSSPAFPLPCGEVGPGRFAATRGQNPG